MPPSSSASLVEPVEDVAETLVHALYERRICCLFGRIAAVDIRLVEARVAVDGDMHCVVAHVEEPGGTVVAGTVKLFQRLLRKGFGDERAAAPVFLQAFDGEARRGPAMLVVTVVLFRKICR